MRALRLGDDVRHQSSFDDIEHTSQIGRFTGQALLRQQRLGQSKGAADFEDLVLQEMDPRREARRRRTLISAAHPSISIAADPAAAVSAPIG
jgi:hypothetical protein